MNYEAVQNVLYQALDALATWEIMNPTTTATAIRASAIQNIRSTLQQMASGVEGAQPTPEALAEYMTELKDLRQKYQQLLANQSACTKACDVQPINFDISK